MAVLLVIAFKWFDWWGGWCYGPRPIVDTMPFFALMLIPVIGWICRHKAALAVFLVLLVWSVGVQALGVLTYEMFGWNKGVIAEVYVAGQSAPMIASTQQQLDDLARRFTILRVKSINRDIDDPSNRHRLWSLSDNQILFYLENFNEARKIKAQYVDIWLKEPER
jgi:hypothetical protein